MSIKTKIFSLILFFEVCEGRLLYQYDKGKLEPERMDYLEFIARVTSHIPDKGQVMVCYYSCFVSTKFGQLVMFPKLWYLQIIR